MFMFQNRDSPSFAVIADGTISVFYTFGFLCGFLVSNPIAKAVGGFFDFLAAYSTLFPMVCFVSHPLVVKAVDVFFGFLTAYSTLFPMVCFIGLPLGSIVMYMVYYFNGKNRCCVIKTVLFGCINNVICSKLPDFYL